MRLRADIEEGAVYGLLELTPELLESLKSGTLNLRSDSARQSVAACTDSHTFTVRRLNQTNTLLLSSHSGDGIVAFGAPASLLEPSAAVGVVDLDSVAIYRRQKVWGQKESLAALLDRSMCSKAEFETICRSEAVFEYEGRACKLENDSLYLIASELVSTMIGEGLGLSARFESVFEAMGTKEPKEAVFAVYQMFYDDEMCQIDVQKAAVWIGRHLLRNLAGEVTVYDFMKQWQHKMPLHLQLDLKKLSGHYFEPRRGTIRGLSLDKLSQDPRARFQQLFQLKSEWELDDIAPFIRDLMDPKGKLENWVLKYARRVKKGSSIIIMPRKV